MSALALVFAADLILSFCEDAQACRVLCEKSDACGLVLDADDGWPYVHAIRESQCCSTPGCVLQTSSLEERRFLVFERFHRQFLCGTLSRGSAEVTC